MKPSFIERFKFINEKTLRWLIYFLTFIWWLKWGIIQTNDTISYLYMEPYRSPGYPVFIKLTTLFGLVHSQFPTLLIALALQIFVIDKLADFLKKHLNLGTFSIISVILILILPDFTLLIANSEMSECIAYPLFLITLYFLLKSIFEKSEKSAIIYFFAVVLLTLVRNQFLFYDAVSVLLLIYLISHSNKKTFSFMRLAGFFVISLASTMLIDRLYHLAVHKSFAPTQFTGLQIIIPATYNLQPKDTNLFKDPIQRGLVDTTLRELNRSELYNLKFKNNSTDKDLFKFEYMFQFMQYKVIQNYLLNVVHKDGYKPENMDFWARIDNITMSTSIKLIKAHRTEYLSRYLGLAKSAFGFTPFMVPFFILFFMSLFALFAFNSKESILLFLAPLTLILNILVVCVVQTPNPRYLFYTYYFLFAVVFMLVSKQIEKRAGQHIDPSEMG